jgi:hypothetical protein
MKAYWEVEVWVHAFLASTLDGTHWIGGCVDPRAGLDAVVKRKISRPGTRTPDHPTRSSALYQRATPPPGGGGGSSSSSSNVTNLKA